MTQRTLLAGALALLVASAHLAAIYMRMETRNVPIDRLVANLERELKSDPSNVQTLINLARLHAMAFALKVDEFPAGQLKPDQPELPSYPPGSSQIPAAVRPAASADVAARAAQHLKDAIRHYEAALALAPDNLTARLGHGWVLQQSGDTQGAITEYRLVIAQAWPSEQKIKALMPSQRLFTQEAAGYLIPLLDTERDAAEIADLRAKQADLNARPRAITPVAIPLTNDVPAHDIVDRLARVRFDADGSGSREWTWITPEAGWLVYDAEDRGSITSALQWFGDVTFWLFWSNGYEPMRALDDNARRRAVGRGIASSRDLARPQSRRRLGPGRSAAARRARHRGAVVPTTSTATATRFAAVSPQGARLSDGSTRPTYDVILRHSASTLTRR